MANSMSSSGGEIENHRVTFFTNQNRRLATREQAEEFTQSLMLAGIPYKWYVNGILHEEFEQ